MPWCSTASLRLCGQVRDSSSRSSDTTPRSFVFRAHRYTAQRRQSRRRGAQEACSRFQGRSLPRLRVAEHDGAEEAKERLPTAEEREEAIAQTLALIGTYDKLAPVDRGSYNPAIMLWRSIKKLTADDKLKLLDQLNFSDIRKMWLISQRLAAAKQDQLAVSMGPDYSLWDEFPEDPGTVRVFEGKAAVPLVGGLGLDRFQKAFFVHPQTFNLMGRVLLRRGLLGDLLYPLYYTCQVERAVVPSTGEVADVSLEYLEPQELPLRKDDLPRSAWPAPGPQRYPFNGGLVDYLRPVGPGVFVGCGWKERLDNGLVGERFLTFVLVARDDK